MGYVTNVAELDDQHILLVQAIGLLEEVLDTEPLNPDDLTTAWWTFHDIMHTHFEAESHLLHILPAASAQAHHAIHTRVLGLVDEYRLREHDDPSHARLRRILTMVRAHTHSAEEQELTTAL